MPACFLSFSFRNYCWLDFNSKVIADFQKTRLERGRKTVRVILTHNKLTRFSVGRSFCRDEFPRLHAVALEKKLLYSVGKVFLEEVADADQNEDDDDGDQAQPEGLLQHPLTQRLVGNIRHSGRAVRT